MSILRAGKKRLKEQKSTITKAAAYARKRELRFSFCSLVCAEWGTAFKGLPQSDAESVFLPRSCISILRAGKKRLKEQNQASKKPQPTPESVSCGFLFVLWSASSGAVLILRGRCARCSLHTRLPLCRRQICRSRRCSSATSSSSAFCPPRASRFCSAPGGSPRSPRAPYRDRDRRWFRLSPGTAYRRSRGL